jgi:hypothetical protein
MRDATEAAWSYAKRFELCLTNPEARYASAIQAW